MGHNLVVSARESVLLGAGNSPAAATVDEGGGRTPSRRLAGSLAFLHHLVDLLEGESLGLPHEEVSVDEAGTASTTPNPKHWAPS